MRKENLISILLTCLITIGFLGSIIQLSYAELLFSDGFETGDFSLWDHSSGNVGISTLDKYNGTYSAKFYTSYMESGQIYKAFSPKAQISAVHFNKYTNISSGDDNTRSYVSSFHGITDKRFSLLEIKNQSGTMTWRVAILHDLGSDYYYGSAVTIDFWYNITEQVKVADDYETSNGHYICYINGTLAFNVTSIDNDETGNCKVFKLAQTREGWGNDIVRFVDDVKIGESFDDLIEEIECLHYNPCDSVSSWTLSGDYNPNPSVDYTDYEEGNSSIKFSNTATTPHVGIKSNFTKLNCGDYSNGSYSKILGFWFKIVTPVTPTSMTFGFRDGNDYDSTTLQEVVIGFDRAVTWNGFHRATLSLNTWYWFQLIYNKTTTKFGLQINGTDVTYFGEYAMGGLDIGSDCHFVVTRMSGNSIGVCKFDFVRIMDNTYYDDAVNEYPPTYPEEIEEFWADPFQIADVLFGHMHLYLGLIGLILLVLSPAMFIYKSGGSISGLDDGFIWFFCMFLIGLGLFVGWLYA